MHLVGFIIRIGAVRICPFGTRIPGVMYSSPEFKWDRIRGATVGCWQYLMFSNLSITLHDVYTYVWPGRVDRYENVRKVWRQRHLN
jgi:hypothetical protein